MERIFIPFQYYSEIKRAIVRNRGSSPPRQQGFNSRAGHHDHGDEIISISKTIRPSDDQLDLVVSSFNACVRKLMLGCGENTCHVPLYLFPEFTKLWNPASLRPGHPFAQKLADTLISRFQREPQILFQQISPIQPWVRCRKKFQLLLLVFGEILWILEQCVSRGFILNDFSSLRKPFSHFFTHEF